MPRFSPLLAALVVALPAFGAKLDYNGDVRPILSENCFYCHGPDANKRKAKLRLDDRADALKHKVFVPGDAEASELVKRLFSKDPEEVMPPPDSHRTVTAAQREILQRWIAEGAEYKPHWAFVAPVRAALPANGEQNPVDAFVVEKLTKAGLTLSPEAPKATLLRRLSLDLTGLPPTPEETAAFLADRSPDAYGKQVDRLMESPHYGERMALPWLDASRYADSNGFQQDGDTFQWVWRDWLVKALNADKPFDQLSTEMLAGDLLPDATLDQKNATAFNRNHILNGEGGNIAEEQRYVSLFDRVESTTTTWLGMTVACAQCHDHKYDPVKQKDYYQWMDAFNHVNERGVPGGGVSLVKGVTTRFRLDTTVVEVPTPDQTAELARRQASFDQLNKDFFVHQKKAYEAWLAKPTKDKGMLPKEIDALLAPEKKRTAAEEKQLRAHYDKVVFVEDRKKIPAVLAIDNAKLQVDGYRNDKIPRVMVMSDGMPRETNILDRGAYLSKKEKVTFDAPSFLPPLPPDAPKNRLGLAQWLFRPEHPLTARVQVNRQWQQLFGKGIVRTSEDLGVQSERPTHQELLDWLSVEFRESGWKTKALQKIILTSKTYRQSSHVTKEQLQKDPENKLLSHAPRLRLPSPILRDVALSTSGLLNAQLGGAPVYPYLPDSPWESLAITKERDFTYPTSQGADLYRRSLYTFWRRTIAPVNMFDSSARQTCRVRTAVTSSPLHALTMLNDPTWVEAARVLAQRVTKEQPTDEARLARAFALVLGRTPAGQEPTLLAKMLANQRAVYTADAKAAEALVATGASMRDTSIPAAEHAALTATCLALYNLDAAVTRD
ncbi:MAG: PSD1 and planctomycete cytochrome C domain-containing protein [Opitutales bacterium]|nr:PSD1 and planctomycete cytochrome C domain-containing protein [Opitutales bacterium]